MKIVDDFNKISDKLKKSIPKLKPGQSVTFQMLNGVPNPEPDQTERNKTPILYGKMQIPTKDRIFDPFLGDTGDYVDIGVLESFRRDRDNQLEIVTKLLVPGMGVFEFGGKFSLRGGKIEDEEMFEYLWICNHNGKNPHRDKSVPALFQPINLLEDSQATIKTTNSLREALNIAGDMSVAEAQQIAASFNWPVIAEDEVLVAKINDFAAKFPDEFLRAINNPKTKMKSEVKKAMDAGIITFDVLTNQVHLGNELIATISLAGGNDFLTAFSDWLKTSKNGEAVHQNMVSRIEEKREEGNAITDPNKEKGKPGRKPKEVADALA